jgi:hypothetical protein
MRNPLIRTGKPIVAMIFVAASLVGSPAAAQIKNPIQAAKDAYNKAKQQAEQQKQQPQQQPSQQQNAPQTGSQPANPSSQPAPAPAAAVAGSAAPAASNAPPNFSKLPDVNGIQLGMTVDQVLPKIKALYPNVPAAGVMVSYVKFEKTADKPWVHSVVVSDNQSQENLTIRFNDPPDEPRVFFVQRSLNFPQGKQTTLANMQAALLQKYGQWRPVMTGQTVLNWSFDEQGNPLNDPKLNGTNCSGSAVFNHAGEGGDANHASIAFAGVDVAPADLQQNPCLSGVHVSADTGTPMANGLVISLTVTMGENSYATRTYMHEQAFIQNAANQQQQQAIQKAQERAAPKF